jgi:ABC-2 type transport system permease protein/oleandomycin transport system permease protein
MTAATFTTDGRGPGPAADGRGASEDTGGSRIGWAVADTLTVTWRNLISYTRIPEQIFFSSVQPIMFTLLFVFVFGGAIKATLPGGTYVDYLMPGIFVQTVMFGAISTAVGLSEDLQKGLIERFRALPMARSAVLGGRTSADLVRNVFVTVLITIVGLLVGFRIGTNFALFLGGVVIMLFFAYAMCWGFAVIGLSAPNSETAQLMAFPVLFPLVFASSAFVPVSTMPGWLQGFATYQPVSVTINAVRSLMIGGPYHNPSSIWQSVLWSAGLLVVLVPLAVRRYRRTA